MFSAFKLRSLRVAAAPVITALMLCLAATQARAQTLLLDAFEDDAVGSAPNGPEVGSAAYGTGILSGTAIADDMEVESDARRWLRVAFGAGTQSMRQLAFNSNFAITASSAIDNVSISVVPEPGPRHWESMAGGLALLGCLTRHCKPV